MTALLAVLCWLLGWYLAALCASTQCKATHAPYPANEAGWRLLEMVALCLWIVPLLPIIGALTLAYHWDRYVTRPVWAS